MKRTRVRPVTCLIVPAWTAALCPFPTFGSRRADDGPRRGDPSLPVDVLYRLHALEILAEDRDDDGYPTGAHALELIARRRVAVINPPGALLSQTKAMQALIWALHEAGEFFDPEEHRIIETYMLPTYLENRFRGIPHVTKPIFGREGAGVTLYDASGDCGFSGG